MVRRAARLSALFQRCAFNPLKSLVAGIADVNITFHHGKDIGIMASKGKMYVMSRVQSKICAFESILQPTGYKRQFHGDSLIECRWRGACFQRLEVDHCLSTPCVGGISRRGGAIFPRLKESAVRRLVTILRQPHSSRSSWRTHMRSRCSDGKPAPCLACQKFFQNHEGVRSNQSGQFWLSKLYWI